MTSSPVASPLPHYQSDTPVGAPGGAGGDAALKPLQISRRLAFALAEHQEGFLEGARGEDVRPGAPQGHPVDGGGAPAVSPRVDEVR